MPQMSERTPLGGRACHCGRSASLGHASLLTAARAAGSGTEAWRRRRETRSDEKGDVVAGLIGAVLRAEGSEKRRMVFEMCGGVRLSVRPRRWRASENERGGRRGARRGRKRERERAKEKSDECRKALLLEISAVRGAAAWQRVREQKPRERRQSQGRG